LLNFQGHSILEIKGNQKDGDVKTCFPKKTKEIFAKGLFIHDLISVVLYFLSSRLKLEILPNRILCSLGELRN